MNIQLDLRTKGGHSSMPFPHTTIGIMSELILIIEAMHFEPQVIDDSPAHHHLICQARYSPDSAPGLTEHVRAGNLEALAAEVVKIDRASQYRIQTSQAVAISMSGTKFNSLPERSLVTINYRIAPQDSIHGIKNRIIDEIKPWAEDYNIHITAFPEDEANTVAPGYNIHYDATLTLTAAQLANVSSISPIRDPVWSLFSGTIQHTFAFPGGQVVPVGAPMTGNTDTRYYTSKCFISWQAAECAGVPSGQSPTNQAM